jgi:hypothetical protein
MSVSVQSLKSHIEKVLSGIRFSNIEMDCRADLVLKYDYSIEEVAAINESKVYELLDNDGKEKTYHNEYGITCSKCGSIVDIEFSDNPEDHYFTICKCGHTDIYTVHFFDQFYEPNAEEIISDMLRDLSNKFYFAKEYIRGIDPFGRKYKPDINKYNEKIKEAIEYSKDILNKANEYKINTGWVESEINNLLKKYVDRK